ncbi:MAG: peptidase C39 [Arcobacteraceae bacterium]|nr:peptidase C39 [Arcobacteraceae bacterium]
MAQILVSLLLVTSFLNAQFFKVKSLKEIKYQDVTQQSFEESCGASAISSLFNMYGLDTTEKDIIKDLNTTDMINFLDLQTIASKHNFKAKGYKITKEIFEQLTIPVIARILRKKDYPHFVVAQNIKGDFVLLLDPNNGKYLVTKENFYNSWIGQNSNYILVTIPTNNISLKNNEFLDISKLDYIKDKK